MPVTLPLYPVHFLKYIFILSVIDDIIQVAIDRHFFIIYVLDNVRYVFIDIVCLNQNIIMLFNIPVKYN